MRSSIALLLLVVLLPGCMGRKLREQQAQATADAAAGIYEAAVAIERGVDPAAPLTAIKASATAIITVNDRTYPPSDAWVKEHTAAPTAPATGAPK